MKKRGFVFAFLALSLTGCNEDAQVKLAEGLGVAVHFADGMDHCGKSQFWKLYEDFNKLSSGEKESFRSRLANQGVKEVLIGQTALQAKNAGEVVTLHLYERRCGNSCWDVSLGSKKLMSEVTRTALEPVPGLVQSESRLILTPQGEDFRELMNRVYFTRSLALYDRTDTVDQAVDGLKDGTIGVNSVEKGSIQCLDALPLSALLK